LGATISSPRLRAAVSTFAPALAILAVQLVFFPLPKGMAFQGLILGLLGALVAVGMALIYRANQILNFAQSELGSAPTIFALCLVFYAGFNYFVALTIGAAAAVLVGCVVELAIIRRFFRAPRLILTVATIGLSGLLGVAGLFIPAIWGGRPTTIQVQFPVTVRFVIDPIVFSADHLVALVVAPLALVGVAVMLRYTSIGIAIRASAERSDRAALLGVPVKRLQTVVWAVAALLSFIGLFLRAGIIGLPIGLGFSFTILLSALAALMLGKLTELPTIALAAVALGLLEQGIVWNNERNPELVDPILALVIVVCLLARKIGSTRVETDTASSWQATDEVRPLPLELRHLREVRLVRWAAGAIGVGLLIAMPSLLAGSTGNLVKASAIVIFVIITMSLGVLTGWAGQVSLGQMSFVAFGAATGAYATQTWHLDLGIALVLAGLVGAAVAVVVGLPALRLRGLFLAVTTLAFAMATSSVLLNRKYFEWVPNKRVERPKLFGAIDLSSQRSYYYLCLACLAVLALGIQGIRRSRTGRVMLALRENERGAQSFGINVVRAKLLAFALSGFLAAFAGCLLVHLLQAFSQDLYGPGQSFVVFTSAVVGGLGSMLGAALGALYLRGGDWFLPGPRWQQLASAIGVLLVLLALPGGLGDLVYRLRDGWLRWVANRRGIVVPSLLADVAVPAEEADHVLEHAEESVEHVAEVVGEDAAAAALAGVATDLSAVAAAEASSSPGAVGTGGGSGGGSPAERPPGDDDPGSEPDSETEPVTAP
jgi:branched-chain amino acid transport system permease protein